ncbi:DUF3040 domain-containing protein [Planctomonas psychrotolerans]|uniref:DUF3040 domain-containing protein n=1 Tax=Planctomonas psychrotolerans TaxID=2528712 RepID=UPI00123BF908|nr:DUF3040 domain-containing protein [Planctomonas psychrotolerans]
MPLSEQEQRLLEEMERSLYHNDADFVATVSGRRGKPNYTSLVVGVLVFVLGIAALATGVIVKMPLIGVLGFAIMLAGVLLAVSPGKAGRTGATPSTPGRASPIRPRTTSSGGDFMTRLNDRWEKRQGGQD